MSQQEPSLVRPDHADAPVSVTGDDAGFTPSFTPENVPKLRVPDLPEDATGLSPEALAQVPTLTDQVDAPATPEGEAPTAPEAAAAVESTETEMRAIEQVAQEPEPEADTWVQQLQVRMDRLMDDIHVLNDRLDRLENKTKV